jgi:hypothetical protein
MTAVSCREQPSALKSYFAKNKKVHAEITKFWQGSQNRCYTFANFALLLFFA